MSLARCEEVPGQYLAVNNSPAELPIYKSPFEAQANFWREKPATAPRKSELRIALEVLLRSMVQGLEYTLSLRMTPDTSELHPDHVG
jgi:hypothetical protein